MPRSSSSFREKLRALPCNVWAVSLTSFFMDISSEMVINLLPLFLSSVLGVKTNIIGLIEGIAEATASILKVFSGWLSDKLRARKWLAVAGYGMSALAKPFFYIANTWGLVAGVRWADRVGKGIRTAPRDALVADSIDEKQRGLAFGFHRAADTAGAMLGLVIALLVIWFAQRGVGDLTRQTFQTVVLISLIPAVLAVLSLAIGSREVAVTKVREMPRISFRGLGKRFLVFMLIVGIFDTFNAVYTLISAPTGAFSDKVGRRRVIIGGWLVNAMIYLGFVAVAGIGWHMWALYAIYGVYYGLAYGTTKVMVADLVPEALRGLWHV